MVRAIAQLDRIDCAACRTAAETGFSRHRMADEYAAVYQHVVGHAADRGLLRPSA